jgi:hypothetical protein
MHGSTSKTQMQVIEQKQQAKDSESLLWKWISDSGQPQPVIKADSGEAAAQPPRIAQIKGLKSLGTYQNRLLGEQSPFKSWHESNEPPKGACSPR